MPMMIFFPCCRVSSMRWWRLAMMMNILHPGPILFRCRLFTNPIIIFSIPHPFSWYVRLLITITLCSFCSHCSRYWSWSPTSNATLRWLLLMASAMRVTRAWRNVIINQGLNLGRRADPSSCTLVGRQSYVGSIRGRRWQRVLGAWVMMRIQYSVRRWLLWWRCLHQLLLLLLRGLERRWWWWVSTSLWRMISKFRRGGNPSSDRGVSAGFFSLPPHMIGAHVTLG